MSRDHHQRAGACEWAYCSKWGAVQVGKPDEPERPPMGVCLTHLVHAQVRGWSPDT